MRSQRGQTGSATGPTIETRAAPGPPHVMQERAATGSALSGSACGTTRTSDGGGEGLPGGAPSITWNSASITSSEASGDLGEGAEERGGFLRFFFDIGLAEGVPSPEKLTPDVSATHRTGPP